MNIDIEIYLKRLKDFFKSDKEARMDMFGNSEIDMDAFYLMVAERATINSKKPGDPVLSPTQMMEIVTDLAFRDIEKEVEINQYIKRQEEIERIFMKTKDGFPPICLN